MPLSLCILETDILPPDLAERYDGYAAMFIRLFDTVSIDVTFSVFNVVNGEYPADGTRFDAYLITGSKADSFGTEPWILRLKEYVQERYHRGDTLLGVCFGHQLLALALGGVAERAAGGWGLGVQRFDIVQSYAWQSPPLQDVSLIVSHQDQVTSLPPNAQCVASSDYCPHAVFVLDDRVLGVQGHPEFTPDYAYQLLVKRQSSFSPERYEQAVTSLERSHQGQVIAQWMLNFILERSKVRSIT
ncbi:GMP synthase-like glutamine amidotransferase [Pseudomonas duriflava]|uniref:GMP synthase-like glutamine amidotransferase n=1 Tax=Pseudomonas duriflava TaxID=459528 RepID=A0A562Q9J5_9PSED|nr:amidotransferase [Pseudomonas duriflava]TWI52696.1 GMP synthase-like glutamine amidotransferase [Pseudomonas duriflava]